MNIMRYYAAPMEGITGFVFRGAHHRYFPGIDKYFSPFIAPNQNRSFSPRELRDILPENNEGVGLVPQILTNRAEDFIKAALELKGMGYDEVNLNLGCPSKTVVTKGRGSGFLAEREKLEQFLDEIFTRLDMKISVKTRIGRDSQEEWPELLAMYNQFPMEELIIHPRIQQDYYKNTPRLEAFEGALQGSRNPVCYNGDLFGPADFEKLTAACPKVETVMLGRGVIANPWLASMLYELETETKSASEVDTNPEEKAGLDLKPKTETELERNIGIRSELNAESESREEKEEADKARLRAFHDEIYAGYETYMSGDRDVLFRMKELWFYLSCLFTEPESYLKKIRKSGSGEEYKAVVDSLFREQQLKKQAAFKPKEA